METYCHLYDPQTSTHYTTGGYISTDSEKPEGYEWLEGYPPEGAIEYQEPTPASNAKALLNALPADLRAKHYTVINNVRNAIENGEWDVIPYLLDSVVAETEEEGEALTEIKTALGV